MGLLLDTHALIWWLTDDPALPRIAREAIADEINGVMVSAASAMEVATKYRIGKLPEATLLAQNFEAIVADECFTPLPMSLQHARMAGGLSIQHKDPFDRLLIAQTITGDLTPVSNERLFDVFSVARLWSR